MACSSVTVLHAVDLTAELCAFMIGQRTADNTDDELLLLKSAMRFVVIQSSDSRLSDS
jgi:hypothetical protein